MFLVLNKESNASSYKIELIDNRIKYLQKLLVALSIAFAKSYSNKF
jgi:hypothetical protein